MKDKKLILKFMNEWGWALFYDETDEVAWLSPDGNSAVRQYKYTIDPKTFKYLKDKEKIAQDKTVTKGITSWRTV